MTPLNYMPARLTCKDVIAIKDKLFQQLPNTHIHIGCVSLRAALI